MINVIFNGFYGDILRQTIENLCRHVSIGYLNIVYYDKKIEHLPVKETQFVKYHSLLGLDGPYSSFGDPNDFIPLDEELITKMSNCERVVLKMMDRLEVGRRYSYQERVDLYYFYLRYWNTIIESHRVNLFISANVPHEIFDYVIYGLCKTKGIPVIFLYHQSQIEDMALIMHDWKENSLKLRDSFQELQRRFHEKTEIEIDLPKKLQNHLNAQVTDSANAVPFYMNGNGRGPRLKFATFTMSNVADLFVKNPLAFFLNCINPIKWGILVFKWFYHLWLQLKVIERLTTYRYHRFYEQHAVTPDLKKKYIYVPLQYQPELSTSPLADAFADQELIIQMISKHVPDDVYLYVKEHPKQTSFCRTMDFYLGLLRTRNVVFMPKSTNSFELIKHCVAVATSTGTPGWEALFREKPVLMFGSYIYQYADGVHKIVSNTDCQRALDQILNHHAKPSLKNMKLYLKALGDVAIPAVIDPDYLRVSKLTAKENLENITQALLAEIKLNLPTTGTVHQ